MNKITGPYSAIVDGQSTGLSGCINAYRCDRIGTCLRANNNLKHVVDLGCKDFIYYIEETERLEARE